jgi:hypothetical protein
MQNTEFDFVRKKPKSLDAAFAGYLALVRNATIEARGIFDISRFHTGVVA